MRRVGRPPLGQGAALWDAMLRYGRCRSKRHKSEGDREMLAFHIGGRESEYVRMSLLRDNGDGWISAQVEVVVGGFRGTYSGDFNSSAFTEFRDELERLYRSLSGLASFTSYERQLEITMTCTTQGHIELRGEAVDYVGTGNRLTFQLELDQTYVPQILADLDAAFERRPPPAI